jgi:hypothetical protein
MKYPKTTILDGDILAYRAAFWADTEGVDELEGRLAKDIKAWTPPGCDQVVIAMSCPREHNFRRIFWPMYKKHRDDFKSPDCMKDAIQCIYDTPDTTIRCVNKLEADDLIGMLVSSGDAIGVTVDKDLRQVPGWHWNPDKETEPVYVSQEEGDKFFYTQWMTGDTTDNVWGLWKVGPAKAKKLLDNTDPKNWNSLILSMYQEEDWAKRPENKRPLDYYREDFALAQARCVRILRNGDFDKDTFRVSLWSPNNLAVRNILDLEKGEFIE